MIHLVSRHKSELFRRVIMYQWSLSQSHFEWCPKMYATWNPTISVRNQKSNNTNISIRRRFHLGFSETRIRLTRPSSVKSHGKTFFWKRHVTEENGVNPKWDPEKPRCNRRHRFAIPNFAYIFDIDVTVRIIVPLWLCKHHIYLIILMYLKTISDKKFSLLHFIST